MLGNQRDEGRGRGKTLWDSTLVLSLAGWVAARLAWAFSRSSIFLSSRSCLLRFLEFRVLIDDSIFSAFKLLWIPILVVVQSDECSWISFISLNFVEYL
jgi:hypothetical protein